MDKRSVPSEGTPPPVGGASLLVVFGVLCLTVFALLSLSTVRADERLSLASAKAVADYYAADCEAQEILARIRKGDDPDGVELSGGGPLYARYAVPISDTQELRVEVSFPDGREGRWDVLCWRAVPTGEWNEDTLLDLWDGE